MTVKLGLSPTRHHETTGKTVIFLFLLAINSAIVNAIEQNIEQLGSNCCCVTFVIALLSQ
jgi:hypothetical protein